MTTVADVVAIVGGGPAGMALALALHQQGIASEIFDARARGAVTQDKRILALSHGSRQILERLGVWHGIPATAIDAIHISQRGRLGRTKLTARDEGVPALGHVLNAGDLAATLDAAVAKAGIAFHEQQKVGTGDTAQYALTAWAEGAVVDDPATVRDYDQLAVLCTATTHEPHHHTAWERFTPDGPLALLPYGKDHVSAGPPQGDMRPPCGGQRAEIASVGGQKGNQYAVVFTCGSADATQLAAEDDAGFLARLQNQFGTRLTFTAAGPRVSYALGLRYRAQVVAERQVWIGNAAQTLHPVAGQGFNLALRDIMELADTLTDAADPGTTALLARYAARRRLDRQATIRFTDGLARLFSNDFPPFAHARGATLLGLDLLPPLRHFVARRMMFGARAW
ncbi:MAG: FAD-dependent monooxygenase [Rhodocyclaceae bacterium]|nr:FAD-dependent monooxygenase [Rhodocyclaceae bacterium]